MIAVATTHYGAVPEAGGVRFGLFAPAVKRAELVIDGTAAVMDELGGGWFGIFSPGAGAGTRYAYRLDGAESLVPDPASRFQPEGVHGPSEVVDLDAFQWPAHTWRGRPWNELSFYELHVGTFTPEGTYLAAIDKLDALVELGITAIELMPLAEAPGGRNWGYDGVCQFAPSHNYGRPEDLVRLVNAAHERGLCIFLDVVYNHFGPEGNYLHGYAPVFFTDRYDTPWGDAIDFSYNDVRRFFTENARYWLEKYRFDGLRLDATQMIFDEQTPSWLEEMRAKIADWTPENRIVHLVLENDCNDVHLLHAGYNAQWNDDFHHAVHALTTGEGGGYYGDYAPRAAWYLGRTLTEGYGYQGEPSQHRNGEARGAKSGDLPLTKFVNFTQNHDQIGNRARGERLAALVPAEAARAAAAVMLLAPSPPLLFMGEEWAASSPFLFFCDFSGDLAKLVSEGRRKEFASFPEFADEKVRATIPDPENVETFEHSKLDWNERGEREHRAMLTWYTDLLRIRASEIVPRNAFVTGEQAQFTVLGDRGVRASWQLGAETLHADINLSAESTDGFPHRSPGLTIFSTHGDAYEGGTAPPWSVRWSLA